MNHSCTRLLATAVLTLLVSTSALVARPASALDDETFGDRGSWIIGGFEYGVRNYSGLKLNVDDKWTRSSASASSYSFTGRGVLWSPINKTALGHMPSINLDFRLGWWGAADGYAGNADDASGGMLWYTKMSFPWTLVDLSWLRFGAGFGFGIGYEMGTPEPLGYNYWGIDFDGFGGLNLAWYPGGNAGGTIVDLTYEYAPFGSMGEGQHRFRAMSNVGWIGLGLRYWRTDLGNEQTMDDFGVLAGVKF